MAAACRRTTPRPLRCTARRRRPATPRPSSRSASSSRTVVAPRPIPWRRWSTIAQRRRLGEVNAQLALARLFRTDDGDVPEDPARSAKWYGEAVAQLEAEARRRRSQRRASVSPTSTWTAAACAKNVDQCPGPLRGGGAQRPHQRPGQARPAAAQGRGRRRCRPREGCHLFPDGGRPGPRQRGLRPGADVRRRRGRAAGRRARGRALQAERWQQGETRAYVRLGDLYAEGDAVRQDYVEALRWYTLAAEHGDPRGFFRLGEAYERGRGVSEDLVQALMWYSLADAVGIRAGGRAGRAGRGQARAGTRPSGRPSSPRPGSRSRASGRQPLAGRARCTDGESTVQRRLRRVL